MPPLDTGSATHTLRLVDPLVDRAEPAPGAFQSVGEYLKAVRERRGHSLVEVADATRVRRAYLEAIEQGNHSALPSRPFAIGYVRAYAKALDLDAEAAAERYRGEAPDQSEALRAPVGVKHDRPERRPLFFVGAAVLVIAVVGWNVAQRVFTAKPAPSSAAAPAPTVVEAPAPQGPIALGAPIPAPADQTTPAPYVTPGLNGLTGVTGIPAPGATAAPNEVLMTPIAPSAYQGGAPPIYAPKAQVYGATGAGPAVVLQARKAASLIIRGPGGEVYFARQLAEGESYRAPVGGKLQAEVTDPAAFSIFVGGQLRGALAAPKAPLDRIAAQIAASAPVLPAPVRPAAAAQAPAQAAVSPTAPAALPPREAPAAAREAPAPVREAPAAVRETPPTPPREPAPATAEAPAAER